jgi:hypothetical protein
MNIHTPKIIATFCAALVAATLATPPRPASADAGLTAALAGVAGIIVGSLLFDSSRHQYYYVRGGRRAYVNDDQAQQYYRRQDPQYFNAHRTTFLQNHQQFASTWNRDHAARGHAGHR